MTGPLTREHLLAAINRAELSGFPRFAAALREIYRRRFGFFTVTGADFRRSLDWARAQPPNPLTAGLAAARHLTARGGCLESSPAETRVLGAPEPMPIHPGHISPASQPQPAHP